MSVAHGPILEVLRKHVQKMLDRFDVAIARGEESYTIMAEPRSNMFCKSAQVTVESVSDPHNPLKVQVHSRVVGEWNPPTVAMIEKLRNFGVDIRDFARTGGPYQTTVSNKKVKKQHDNPRMLTGQLLDFARTPEWEDVRTELFALWDDFREYAHTCVRLLREKPELLLDGKPGTTGTGLRHPYDTREKLAANFEEVADELDSLIDKWYDDKKEAYSMWPEMGAEITVHGDLFQMVTGARSDADVVEWHGSEQHIATSTRDITNTPPSCVMLKDKTWTRATIDKTMSEYDIPSYDLMGQVKSLTTPPATMPGDDPEEMVLWSIDIGGTSESVRYDGNRLVVVNAAYQSGADQLVGAGITMRVPSSGKRASLKASGEPETFIDYNVLPKRFITKWAQNEGLVPMVDLWMWQNGDDVQIGIKRKHIAKMAMKFGHIAKTKGMPDVNGMYTVFVTGRQAVWKDRNNVAIFVVPRYIKSVSSAKVLDRDRYTMKVGDVLLLNYEEDETPEEVIDSIEAYWVAHATANCFIGKPEDYVTWAETDMLPALAAEAAIDGEKTWLEYAGIDLEEALANLNNTSIYEKLDQRNAEDEKAAEAAAEEAESEAEADTTADEDDEAAEPDQQESSNPVIVYGGPTTGKSEAQQKLQAKGYTTKDSDELMAQVLEKIGQPDAKPWELDPAAKARYSDEYTKDFVRWIHADDKVDFYFTNYWQGLCAAGIQPDLAFWRTSPEEINELTAARGGTEIPLDVIQKWKANSEQICFKVTPLGAGEYVSDHLEELRDTTAEEDGVEN